MSEVLVASYTAIIGVILLVLSQIVQRFIIEPIQDYRKLRGEVAYALIMYANIGLMHNTPEERKIAHEQKVYLRGLASDLRRNMEIIPFYSLFVLFRVVDNRRNVIKASNSMVGWSNCTLSGKSEVHRDGVAEALKIDWRGKNILNNSCYC